MEAAYQDYVIFSGNGSTQLASDVARALDREVAEARVSKWANDEIRIQLQENVRGDDVFLCQSFAFGVLSPYTAWLVSTTCSLK